MTVKAGTRIEIKGWDMAMNETWEKARITRWNTRLSGPQGDGWHSIRYDLDGGRCLVHETRFRVVDNRA